jgi:SAM-dependent methyltransferase
MKSESYGSFAYAYDQALGERFFRAAQKLLADVLARYPSTDKTHLDLACGTGLAMRFFAEQEWQSIGVDISLPMLQRARRRGPRIVAGDLRSVPLSARFARITCLYDSLNHLKNHDELVAAFRQVAMLMNGDSLFVFDMNHPDIYPDVWGMKEPFVSNGPRHHLEIATAYRRRDATGLALVTGWALLPSGERAEIRERHEQRAYSEGEIVESLDKAGLTPVEVRDFDPYNDREGETGGVKLFFVCRLAVDGSFRAGIS